MNSFLLAWRASRVLPVSVVRGAAWTVAMVGWATGSKPRRRWEQNLARVTGASGRELSALSRRGLRSVARYYAEVLEMSRLTGEAIDARVRVVGLEGTGDALSGAKPAVAVLGHCGNWDLVGAWACRNLMPVTAVAEKLEPPEVFDEFVSLRSAHGMRILGHEGGSTFRALLRIARDEPSLVCLVADRDLSGSGIPVSMWGQPVKVAPGPAALSLSSGAPLVPVLLHYERLHGARRRKARSAWGTVLSFGPVLEPAKFTGERRVEDMTQAWASSLADAVAAHPQDWHMLQRFGWLEGA